MGARRVRMHQHLTPADHTCQDELESQRFVTLRDSGPVSVILDLYTIGKTRHGHSPKARRRSVTVVAMPLLIVIGFAVTGILVASIALNPQRSHPLVQPGSKLCGLISSGGLAGSDNNSMHEKATSAATLRVVPRYIHNNAMLEKAGAPLSATPSPCQHWIIAMAQSHVRLITTHAQYQRH